MLPKSSKSNVEVVITPPKIWFEESEEFKKEIKLYDYYLSFISSNPKVSKICNLYYFIKDEYSSKDYVDAVHLSKTGHQKWAKKIESCLRN